MIVGHYEKEMEKYEDDATKNDATIKDNIKQTKKDVKQINEILKD